MLFIYVGRAETGIFCAKVQQALFVHLFNPSKHELKPGIGQRTNENKLIENKFPVNKPNK